MSVPLLLNVVISKNNTFKQDKKQLTNVDFVMFFHDRVLYCLMQSILQHGQIKLNVALL